jgi:DNA polymerase-3 subunit epsilon
MELDNLLKDLTNLNFSAIDFETANEQRASVCSIGLVTVKNGIITEKNNIYIKPKELRFTDINKRIHGISEKDVLDAPEFNKVWEKINPIVDNQILLAHNADFDIDVLRQTLDLYNLNMPTFKFICTQKLAQEAFPDLQNYRLADVAAYLEIDLIHHNSLSDATVAAEIGLKAIPIYDKRNYSFGFDELTYYIQKKGSANKIDNFSSGFTKKNIDSNLLKPNLEVDDKDNIFYNRRVVFTGDMQEISRQDAAVIIQNLGADINTAISKKTEIVVIGNGAGPSKMKKIAELNSSGCKIQLIYEQEFLSLIQKK